MSEITPKTQEKNTILRLEKKLLGCFPLREIGAFQHYQNLLSIVNAIAGVFMGGEINAHNVGGPGSRNETVKVIAGATCEYQGSVSWQLISQGKRLRHVGAFIQRIYNDTHCAVPWYK